MDIMFWVWLAIIVVTIVVEAFTMEIISIWFTVGAIPSFILAGFNAVGWEIQLVIFIVISAVLILSLRKITKNFLLRNSNAKTNLASVIGTKVRMIEMTDFDSIGTVKLNGVTWSAVGENGETIESGAVVEIVKIEGNKLFVKEVDSKEKNKK
ncbi:MAG: NfeD family protein [Clostridia bacterium]|nr:NfeD family protein [Clostridia bacterium]